MFNFFLNTITAIKSAIVHGGYSSCMVSKVHDFLGNNGIKITLDYRPKKWGKYSLLYVRFEEKNRLLWFWVWDPVHL